MPPARLTERQDQAYEFIRAYVRTRGKPPTLQEIGAALSIRSTNGVSKHLRALEQKGYIRRTPNEARGIALVDAAADPYAFDTEVPSLLLVSRTDSAHPGRLRLRPKGALFTDPLFLEAADEEKCLIGRAGDDGMSGAGILKGDYLVIEEKKWRQLDDGVIAAVLVGESLVARTFHLSGNRFRLRPANRTYSEETFTVKDPACHVIGPIRSVMRRL